MATARKLIAKPSCSSSVSARAVDLAIAGALALFTLLVYAGSAGPLLDHQSSQPHFVLLADAILHGHLWIDPARASRLGDITPAGGQYYVSFPPMPAIVLLPLVAIFGPRFDDVLFSVGLGAFNVALAYRLVRRLSAPGFLGQGIDLGRAEAAAVALLLGLGTVHFYSAAAGTVWYLAHVVATTFLLLYLIECAGRGRPLVAGLALAAAFLARTPTILGLVLWLVFAIRRRKSWSQLVSSAVVFGAPAAAAAGLLLGQNLLRFGALLDFGYYRMQIARQLAPDLSRYGQFSPHFLSRNIQAFLLSPPIVRWSRVLTWLPGAAPGSSKADASPLDFDPWGTGIWAVSPALVFSLRLPSKGQLLLTSTAWASAVLIALPDLLYYNTGWYQFGYRFSLDFTPFLLVLTAFGLRRPLHPIGRVAFGCLLLASIVSNFLGTRWFLHLPPH